jgi:EAL domain-containing protein (putative c-di-GMP-specific phosphodiesterase class I)
VSPSRARRGGRPRKPRSRVRGGPRRGAAFQPRPGRPYQGHREASRLGLESDIFINFNPTSIYDPAYCLKSTIGAIERSELSSDRVVFEITESEYVRDDRHLRNILDFYRRSGFKIALDDLGAGCSSLNLLAALRPDFVKLDARLDQDVDHGYYRAAIASKLLELAKDLAICVIAEGVETEEQWRWLSDNGADLAQGYLFARPVFPPLPISVKFAQPEPLSRVDG